MLNLGVVECENCIVIQWLWIYGHEINWNLVESGSRVSVKFASLYDDCGYMDESNWNSAEFVSSWVWKLHFYTMIANIWTWNQLEFSWMWE